jgi:NAD-dependent dihydropyrimidine dehydrogenase PreA subunit
MFTFYVLVAIPFAIFGFQLLAHYLVVALAMLVVYLLASPWIPGRTGLSKSFSLALPLGVLLFFSAPWSDATGLPLTADLIIAIGAVLGFGVDLGGMSATLPSSFDPLMARLGVRKAFNIEFAGSTRTDLLLGRRRLICDPEACIGCEACVEICPRGVWAMGDDEKATVVEHELCTACKACMVQCPSEAIMARSPE